METSKCKGSMAVLCGFVYSWPTLVLGYCLDIKEGTIMFDDMVRKNLITSAYKMHLGREPSMDELIFHYHSEIRNSMLNLHVRNSDEARMRRNSIARKMGCCRK
jgi:hypothetical protein